MMTTPCNNCPFRRRGGIRLSQARVREIGGMMLSTGGGSFPCHKTTVESDDDGERHSTPESQACAGSHIFAEKHGNATQMMRISERLGLYDPTQLREQDAVFDTLKEMLAANRGVFR